MKVDVAIVGGRCSGSVLALRLARAGARVAIVDRDQIGTDTLSTHAIWPNTIARLEELGLLSALLERHEVPLVRYRVRILGHETVGEFTPIGDFDRGMAPRRVALDRVIAEAALEAGAEARFGEKVADLVEQDGRVGGVKLESGETIEAEWTIGADGRASTVAGQLGLERERPLAGDLSMLLAYWRGLPETDVLTLDIAEERGLSRFPCEDGSSCSPSTDPRSSPAAGPRPASRRTWRPCGTSPRRSTPRRSTERSGSPRSAQRPRPCCGASSAGQAARAGHWWETLRTSSTPPPPRGSPTPSSRRSTSRMR